MLIPPLSALSGTFPHEWEKGNTKYSHAPLLPFMGEMASGQRGRERKNKIFPYSSPPIHGGDGQRPEGAA
ncbi:MAG: hypothetical protein CVV49_07215 [Spirochaetae bacterium HGW-Spirochaetae-5]|nr:MAG: hypothetical protein CVV49_07215 [Spirochaetae bacterium HGW-Spirochaetae-5]